MEEQFYVRTYFYPGGRPYLARILPAWAVESENFIIGNDTLSSPMNRAEAEQLELEEWEKIVFEEHVSFHTFPKFGCKYCNK
jgi:hypothetical protein